MAVNTFNPSRALRLQKTAFLTALALAAMFGLAGCDTTNTSDAVIRIDKAQGSEENIASLTAVINANPRDPEGYNVRGSAYGRAGQFRPALNDFNTALQINPRFFQAYANRALVYRNMGQQDQA
ncbi:tetratricopeptide repeat protein, partial [Rhizobium ruizarguesonis]